MFECLKGKRLYKFYSYNERNLEAIASPYLWFSGLRNFNDPFEGKFNVQTQAPSTGEGLKLLKRIFIYKGKTPIEAEAILRERYIGHHIEDINMDISRLMLECYNKTEFDLMNGGFCSLISSGTDLEEKLSPSQDILMWSHYANGLRGFRVEFDPELLIASLSESPDCSPILYKDAPPSFNLFDFCNAFFDTPDKGREILTSCLFTKHMAWSYESEIRLGNSTPGKYFYGHEAIKEIVIGEKINTDQRNVLVRVINSVNRDIPIKKAWIGRESYDVIIR